MAPGGDAGAAHADTRPRPDDGAIPAARCSNQARSSPCGGISGRICGRSCCSLLARSCSRPCGRLDCRRCFRIFRGRPASLSAPSSPRPTRSPPPRCWSVCGSPPPDDLVLMGESLVNDASGIVLYRFAVAAALTGTFNPGLAALQFIYVAVAELRSGSGAGSGSSGFSGGFMTRIWRSPSASWRPGRAISPRKRSAASGVLATVTCGLWTGWRQHTGVSRRPASKRRRPGPSWFSCLKPWCSS